MKKHQIQILSVLLFFTILFSSFSISIPVWADTTGPDIAAPSAILMEASTGTILYEKNSHEKLRPASITKIMTLILVFEALENGKFSLDDTVTVSEYAASMGGSQVYLEPGETQTVNDLLKCVSIASANDACVALAEFVAGSESAFVQKMNEKAASLGMNDTNFVNCCGLEAEGHLTTAYDIALMSRELSMNHPQIHDYCTIWMDSITHTTRKGSSEFGLTNTNKFVRYYSYATGLKTGYTSQSKYCLAGTATRDNVNLISVVMAEESPTVRTKDTITLMDYGFASCQLYRDANEDRLSDVTVKKGTSTVVPVDYTDEFVYVVTDGSGTDDITKEIVLPEEVTAPIQKGDIIGTAIYKKSGADIGSVDIIAATDVAKQTFSNVYSTLLKKLFTVTAKTDAEYSYRSA
ncbi:MAG: D-alanyl-D-alanine carboxypeptidase [Agathobacter sp.]|nr:D-alanyl-D-alanine carboxypeptidase [Agathobacter sp.]